MKIKCDICGKDDVFIKALCCGCITETRLADDDVLRRQIKREVGIKDRHGTPIIEGLLVKQTTYHGMTDEIETLTGTVVYEPEAWSFLIEDKDGKKWNPNPYADFQVLSRGIE